jgi:hypothetical protein
MKRRDFIKLSSVTAGATLIPLVNIPAVFAEEKPRLSLDDPQAKALDYTEVSPVEGQYCNNCVHATGDMSAEWVGCNLFPGKLVKGPGWCKVWAAR